MGLKSFLTIGIILVVYFAFLYPSPFQNLNWIRLQLNPVQYHLPLSRAEFTFYENQEAISDYESFLNKESLNYNAVNSSKTYFTLISAGGAPIQYYSFETTDGKYGLLSAWNCSSSYYKTTGTAKDQYSLEMMKNTIQSYVCLQ